MQELGGLFSGLRRSTAKARLPLYVGLTAFGLILPAVACSAPAQAAPEPAAPAPITTSSPTAPAATAPAPAPTSPPADSSPTAVPPVTLAPAQTASPSTGPVTNASEMNPSVLPKMPEIKAERGIGGATLGQGLTRLKKRHSTQDNTDNETNKRLQSGANVSTQSLTRVLPSLVPATWMAPGVQGLDVSGWQSSVNWSTQWSMGARFAYVKATEGVDFQSSGYATQYVGAANAGFIRGAYHFALPSQSSGATQADYFVNHGGGWSADGKTLPPLLDIEYNPYSTLGNTCYNMSASAMVGWIKDFSNRVLYRTGRLPMIYTTTDWWSKCTGNSAAFGNQPLHIAAYSQMLGALPLSWSTYSVWQYSSTGPFAGDSNAWNGTYTNLQKFATTPDGAAPQAAISSTADVVAADSNGALWDYSANGAGGFSGRKQIGNGWTGLRSINVIDWNGDGVLDIVAQWNTGKVNVYLGNTSSGFNAGPVLASSGWAGYQLTISYPISSSYYPQIISRDNSGNLLLWRNNSGSTLSSPQQIGNGWAGLNMFMIDYDGDGNQDVLAQDTSGYLKLFRMDGTGHFISEARKVVGSGWNTMTSVTVGTGFAGSTSVGLMARSNDGSFRYYPVPGNSTIGSPLLAGNGWNGFLIAGGENINMTAPAPSPSPTPTPTPTPTPAPTASPSITSASNVVTVDSSGALWRYSPANGSLGTGTKIGGGFSTALSVHVADWNSDGVQDLVVQWSDGRLSLYTGAAAGGFDGPTALATGWADADLVVGKWVSAGKYPGIIAQRPDGTLTYYANASGGALSAGTRIGSGFIRMHPVLADVDNDGNLDVAVVDNMGQFIVYRGNGTGGFISEARPVIGNGWNTKSSISSAAGFTGGSQPGVLAATSAGALTYYPFAGGRFGSPVQLSGTWAKTLFDGSRTLTAQPPLLSTNDVLSVDGSGRLWNTPSTGSASLSGPFQIGNGWSSAKALQVTDWNADGVPDVVAQFSDGSVAAYLGSAAGGFSQKIVLASSGLGGVRMTTGYWLKGSKYPGIVGITSSGALMYWGNPSGAALAAPQQIGTGWGSLRIAMADFDSDGNQDLLAVDGGGTMRLYRSNGASGFIWEARKVIGGGWNTITQFTGRTGFAGSGSQGVSAIVSGGTMRYYAILPGATWAAPVQVYPQIGSVLTSF
ncbi:GH25 family lysozyme [Paenarthrobacter sp. DKR-5]|uniref:GH25 family lysozyme n=1 Tax=Paenarthrobacter sp. DKR-5 TaxID=2835535 RepID=UPI002027E0D7|nr:GH25 family lysozyme [Paenarthrobacter sp. DKR-5]